MEYPVFTNWYNFKPGEGEVNKEKSLTIPDMSYSIKELMSNFTRLPDIGMPAVFDDDPDIAEDMVGGWAFSGLLCNIYKV